MNTIRHRNLAYRCRRGTRELEVLLNDYLNHHYNQSTHRQQRVFHWLLSLEDDQLWDWILQEYSDSAKIPADQLKQAIESYINQTCVSV